MLADGRAISWLTSRSLPTPKARVGDSATVARAPAQKVLLAKTGPEEDAGGTVTVNRRNLRTIHGHASWTLLIMDGLSRSRGKNNRFVGEKGMKIMLIANDYSAFDSMAKRLEQEDGVRLAFASSGAVALELMREKGKKAVDLVILGGHLSDMPGIRFVRQLVRINPLVYTAVIGSLPDKDFHEATEGLGVLLQLPRDPKEQHAETLLVSLRKITALMQTEAGGAGNQ